MTRELWSLFNLHDTASLRVAELVQGVTSICQLHTSQDFCDFYPGVRLYLHLL